MPGSLLARHAGVGSGFIWDDKGHGGCGIRFSAMPDPCSLVSCLCWRWPPPGCPALPEPWPLATLAFLSGKHPPTTSHAASHSPHTSPVVTNFHVVKGANEVRVTLLDQTSVVARLVGADPDKDVAVLQASLAYLCPHPGPTHA